MNNAHKIFSKGVIGNADKNVIQKVRYNRTQLLSKDVAKDLNTYLNFGVFPTYADTSIPYYKNGKLTDAPGAKAGVGTPGVRSIFNRSGAMILGSYDGKYNIDVSKGDPINTHPWRIANNVPLMDSPLTRQRIRRSSGCSIRELVKASKRGEMGQETYAYSDFMYCKHLGKVSNNYLITLRRFPLPVDDYIGARGEMAGGDEGDVLCAHVFQLFKNIRKLRWSDGFSSFGARNLVVLTKSATQIAPRKEDGAASLFKGNARLFKGVKVVFCNVQSAHAACANALCSVRAALYGTEFAVFQKLIHTKYYNI